MTTEWKENLVLALEQIVFTFVFGFWIWLLPFLQHWIVYVLWSPGMGVLHGWAVCKVREPATFNVRISIGRGVLVGVTHFIATTVAWIVIAKVLPPALRHR